jgi:hypothetical protein
MAVNIEFGDAGPQEILLNTLAGWVVRINDDVDIFVTGTEIDDKGWRQLVGLQCDEEGNPIDPPVERRFGAEGLDIYIY